MKVSGFPACCGAAILYGFSFYGEYYYNGKFLSYTQYKNEIHKRMRIAQQNTFTPEDLQIWPVGRVSIVYAITAANIQNGVAKMLGELGWQKEGEPVENVNTGRFLQMYSWKTRA